MRMSEGRMLAMSATKPVPISHLTRYPNEPISMFKSREVKKSGLHD